MMWGEEGNEEKQTGVLSNPSDARDILNALKMDRVRGTKRETDTGIERQDDVIRTKRRKMGENPDRGISDGRRTDHRKQLSSAEGRGGGPGNDGRRPGAGRGMGKGRGSSRGSYRQGYKDRMQDRMYGRQTSPETCPYQRRSERDHNAARRLGTRTRLNSRYGQTQYKYGKNQGNFTPLSSRLLIEILEKDPCDAATELGSLKGSLKAGLNEDLMVKKRQHLFWKALAFVCGAIGAEQTVIMLMTLVIDSKLFKQYLPRFLISLRLPGVAKDEEQAIRLKNVITVLQSMMQSFPSRASDLKVAATLISDAVTGMDGDDKRGEIMESIKSLNNNIEDIEREKETKRHMDRISKNPPPDDFRQQNILPTLKELQAGYQPFLRPHLTRGVYVDADHYLDVQFRLLKEDFIYPLRNGISDYLTFKNANPDRKAKIQDMRIYDDAHYTESVRDFSGISHYMAFKKLPRVQWHSTKRLMYGSLLILSSDDFKSYLFATVAKRDVEDLRKGLVAISLIDQEDASCLRNQKYVMAESSVFFEAYRPVLLGLQRMSGPSLPFSRYILSICHDVKAPEYLRDQMIIEDDGTFMEPCKIDISPLLKHYQGRPATIEVLDDGAWPDNDEVQLDQSQYEAVKTALTKELSIIQGPPGTGKTYIGLKIVETLLRNREVWSSEENPSPILLVCYTNHALDQFLEGILTFRDTGIVRVGSRSKSEQLRRYNLQHILRQRHDEQFVERRVRHVKKEVDVAKRLIERTQVMIKGARHGIFNEDELGQFMSWQHYNSLRRFSHMEQLNSWLVEWLLCERQHDRDWNQHERKDIVEQRNIVQEGDKEEGTNHDLVVNEATIEVEYERSAIESERIIDDEYDKEGPDEVDIKDCPFPGLHLNELDKPEDGMLRKYIQRKMSGKDVYDPRVLDSIFDVWRMHPNDRWVLYHTWLKNYLVHLRETLTSYDLKFKQLCAQLDEAKYVEKYHVLRGATIIGMTTTAAANHQQVLKRVRPKIIVVEEAAEVLEAHIVTALNAACQQLILIGDHQQLRPKPNVYLLAKKYHLDVSLFERLINNDFPHSQLELQHRMRTELSALMRRNFYNKLQDHETVTQYESIKSVEKNIFFLNHAEPEDEMEDTQSHYNLREAGIVVKLCQYFLQQGYEPSKVTILTAYSGQLLKVKKMMDRTKFDGIKVTSIDNYQGEENDVVIVSFVRSNNHGRIGFVGISNRVCVALSRAKKGLYCIGNFTLFAEKSELWKGIVKDLESTGSIGDSLTLQCTNHPDQKTAVTTADDFNKVPLGGCSRDCDTKLDCGHVCRLKCHPTDQNHVVYQCKEIVDKILSCSHVRLLPCHRETTGLEEECEIIITKELQCGHIKTEKCNGSGRCNEKVLKVLECNHTCVTKCHKDPKNIMCEENVRKTLPCGHTHTLLCSRSIDNFRCNTITTKLLECGHEITEGCCHESKCPELVEKTLPCGHKLRMRCSTDVETVVCNARCCKKLICGHICQERCGRDCTQNCSEMFFRDDWPCGHVVNVRCCDNRYSCDMVCGAVLMCGHSCKGICGMCSLRNFHLLCSETCGKKLACGHDCTLKCGAPCLSCEQNCPRRCSHSHCKHPCSELCSLCRRRCNWKCDHYKCTKMCCDLCDRPPCNKPCPEVRKCGHPCIGLCGEICPNKCRICDRGDLENRYFGTEDLETARYIQLEDCDHFFEVGELDKFLGFGTSSDAVTVESFTKLSVKSCPRCAKPMQTSRRYGNLLKESCMTKIQIVLKLLQEELKTYQLLHEVNSTVSTARRILYILSRDRPISSFLTLHLTILGESYDLLQESTEELDKHNKASLQELINERAFDIWSQINRVRILCDLIKHMMSGVYNSTKTDNLLQILRQESNLDEDQLATANALLNKIYAAKGYGQQRESSDLTIFRSPTYLSYEVAAWRTCPRGHPVATHQLKENCKECDREKAEQKRVSSKASTSECVCSGVSRDSGARGK